MVQAVVQVQVLVAVLLAGTAAARARGTCSRQAGTTDTTITDSLINLAADFVPNIMDLAASAELADTLDIAKEIAMSRWTSREVFKSDLKTAALISEAMAQNVPGKLVDRVKRTANAATDSLSQNSCRARPKSPRMAYGRYGRDDEEDDGEVEVQDEDDGEGAEHLQRFKYVPGEDDGYARVYIQRDIPEDIFNTIDEAGPLPEGI